MALLHFDGFEWMGTGGENMLREYVVPSGGAGLPGTGRLFGQSNNATNAVFTTRSFGLRTTLVTGYGWNINGDPGAGRGKSFLKGGVEQFRWEYVDAVTGFTIVFKRGATTLGTSPIFAYNAWHYFEIKAVIDTGTSGSIELRRNEVPVLTLTSINTANVGTSGADAMGYNYNTSTGNPLWDDFYILDTTGSDNNDFLGDSAIEGFTVTADGATIQWTRAAGTANFQMVDDGNSNSDTNDYNSSDTVGQIDLFVCSDLVFTTGTIFGVKVSLSLAMSAAGSRNVGTRFRDSGGSGAAGGTFAVTTTSYSIFSHIFERNPISTLLWTNADVNGGQFGYEVLA